MIKYAILFEHSFVWLKGKQLLLLQKKKNMQKAYNFRIKSEIGKSSIMVSNQ
jgi:hypothetical protein